MSAALSCEPDEPLGSGLPGDGRDADEGIPQGLYVTAPAEELSLEGFAADGRADTMAPGPLLAMILDTVAGQDGEGLPALSDDQLIGFLSGTRRMQSRLAWARLAALAEFATRPRRADFAADEVAAAFHLTWLSAAGEIDYARTVKRRLPVTFAALAAGMIDAVHVQIIDDATSILSDEDAAIADEQLAQAARDKTYAELRRAANRLVIKLDPEAVRKRREKARREARVRAFREESGNAGITGRELPSVEVLASMQHVEDRARALRAAGVPGTWEELKVRATLDLLQERDSRPDPGDPPASGDDAGSPGPGASGPGGELPRTGGPSVGALITITVPHTALDSDTGPPGEADGFGILDHADTRDLVAAAAGHPATRWCVTVLNPRRDRSRPWLRCRIPPLAVWPGTTGTGDAPRPAGVLADHQHHPGHPRPVPARRRRAPLPAQPQTPAPDQGPQRDLRRAGLRPPRRELRPGPHPPPPPRRPDLRVQPGPLCRHHHRCKQAEGWRLEQPEPGVLVWHTPAGRTYTTIPTHYAA